MLKTCYFCKLRSISSMITGLEGQKDIPKLSVNTENRGLPRWRQGQDSTVLKRCPVDLHVARVTFSSAGRADCAASLGRHSG
jgi:hypothetical protein